MKVKTHHAWRSACATDVLDSPYAWTSGDTIYHAWFSLSTIQKIEEAHDCLLFGGFSFSWSTLQYWDNNFGNGSIVGTPGIRLSVSRIDRQTESYTSRYMALFPHKLDEGIDPVLLRRLAEAVLFNNSGVDEDMNPFHVCLLDGCSKSYWVRRRLYRPHEDYKCDSEGCLETGYIRSPDNEQILCGTCYLSVLGEFRHNPKAVALEVYSWAFNYLYPKAPIDRDYHPSDYGNGGFLTQEERMDVLGQAVRRHYEFEPDTRKWLHLGREEFGGKVTCLPELLEKDRKIREFTDFPMEGK